MYRYYGVKVENYSYVAYIRILQVEITNGNFEQGSEMHLTYFRQKQFLCYTLSFYVHKFQTSDVLLRYYSILLLFDIIYTAF